MSWIWLGVIILTVAYELITYEMESIWFTIGAIVALILSFFVKQWWIQVIVFALVSLVMFISLRKWARRLLTSEYKPTNADSFIGKKIKVTKAIKKDKDGEGIVNSVVWTLESEDDEEIEENEFVIIKNIVGNKLIVKKEDKK